MREAVSGVFHLYFGDASRHPIVGNYMRSLPDLPQEIVLQQVPQSRFRRLWKMIRSVRRKRARRNWALQCHDVVAGIIGVFLWKGRVIYDSHEIYSSFPRLKVVARIVAWLERIIIRRAEITVFPSTYRSEYYNIANCDVRIIENLYYPYRGDERNGMDVVPHQQENQNSVSRIRFVYTGLFTPIRAINEIVDAFKSPLLETSELILAGQATSYLDEILENAPNNVSYRGELSHVEVGELLQSADAGFALYRPVNENNRRCAPTKLFEFLYFGLQVIASRSPYITEINERVGGERIMMVNEINTQSILNLCTTIKKKSGIVNDALRQSVDWESQLTELKSLYA